MPRLARKKSEINCYHVIVQGLNKEFVFKDDNHIETYKNIIINKLKDSNITILSYCIMNNHAHFLIYSEESENLSKFMQRINTAYSHFYNKKHKRVGYVFRDRYYSQTILNKKQLYTCVNYIHKNPVKAHIVKEMSEYKYSSYNEFFLPNQIITYKSLKILFDTKKNYLEQFQFIHNTNFNEKFVDIKEKSINEFISEFETTVALKIDSINHTSLLKTFINGAREQTDVTIVQLAQLLGISKTKVGYLIHKN